MEYAGYGAGGSASDEDARVARHPVADIEVELIWAGEPLIFPGQDPWRWAQGYKRNSLILGAIPYLGSPCTHLAKTSPLFAPRAIGVCL
jgi:hypothetical protein